MSKVAVGVRLDPAVIAQLTADGRPIGEVVREAVDGYLRGPVELVGFSQAADILGVATGNLGKVAGLPAPLYDPRTGGPSGGRLYDAAEIRALAARRRAARDAA